MRKCNSWPVSVCSWSFQKDISEVAEAMQEIGYRLCAISPSCRHYRLMGKNILDFATKAGLETLRYDD